MLVGMDTRSSRALVPSEGRVFISCILKHLTLSDSSPDGLGCSKQLHVITIATISLPPTVPDLVFLVNRGLRDVEAYASYVAPSKDTYSTYSRLWAASEWFEIEPQPLPSLLHFIQYL